METNNFTPLNIKTVDSEPMSPEEILAERQQYILSVLPQLFEMHNEPDGNTLVHCLKADVREILGNVWFQIIRDYINYKSNKGDYSNLADEEAELVLVHRLNQYLSDGCTKDMCIWAYWLIYSIEAEVADKTREKSDLEVFDEGLYKYFDADDLPDGSYRQIERFKPGIEEQIGDTFRQIVEEFYLLDEEDELSWRDIEFRFWRFLNEYAHEGGCVRNEGRWGAKLIRKIEAALESNADAVDIH